MTIFRQSIVYVLTFTCLVFFVSCSENEIKKLREKATQAEKLLQAISDESSKLLGKIKMMVDLEKQSPKPADSIEALKNEIKSEQNNLTKLRETLNKLWDEIVKETSELSSGDLKDALDWLKANLPLFFDYFTKMVDRTNTNGNKVLGASQKVNTLQSVVGQEVAKIEALLASQNEEEKAALRLQLTALQVQHTAISFHEEIHAAQQVAGELGSLGPFPVVAGKIFQKETFMITEGLPEPVAFLDDGVLATGTTILVELPKGWRIKAPAIITSDTLDLSVRGNYSGSSQIMIIVAGELIPQNPDDSIKVVLRNVYIGNTPGLARGVLMVNPGRIITHDFFVFQSR